MNKVILFATISLVVLVCASLADVPQLMSYQGRLVDDTGQPVADGDYSITFQITEHSPMPMGETPLWSSGLQSVTVTDGLFVYNLGSNVPLPASVFTDNALESHYLRFALEGSPVYSPGVRLATSPFAFKATHADTAAYASSGPGSGTSGWVDDGTVVRLDNGGDRVGVGVSDPSEALVVGRDLGGTIDNEYVVCGIGNPNGYAGYKLGFNSDNFAEMKWYGTGEELRFNTRSLGVNYLNTLVLRQGRVGINNLNPVEPLVIGDGFSANYGDMIQISRAGTGRYAGLMFGEDDDNRGQLLWYNNTNEVRLGYKTGGSDHGAHLVLRDGEMIVTGTGDSSVQLGANAISSAEILNEAGLKSADRTSTFIIRVAWADVLSTSCDFPSPGYAVVIATAELDYFRYGGFSDTVEFAITDGSGVGPHAYFKNFGNRADHDGEYFYDVVTLHEIFAVDAGTETFHFKAGSGQDDTDGYKTRDARMTVMFFPTVYSSKQSSDEEVSQGPDITAVPMLFTSGEVPSVTQAAPPRADQVSALRAEFDAKLEIMEEEFQRKLLEMENNR